jgi:hypothetical protein
MGRRTSSPPQFGQTPCRMFSAQSRHQVHSYVQTVNEPLRRALLRARLRDSDMTAVYLDSLERVWAGAVPLA